MYKRILLAVDGSENSLRAVRDAFELARISEGAVELVYVIDYPKMVNAMSHIDRIEQLDQQHRQRLLPVESLLESEGILYEWTILRGEPGPTIVNYANANAFDLVVVGSRGRNPLQEFVIGSVSHKVLKRARCPVLIVK
ncbi:universal stress protein [Edaphobacillus lindanitolerans]|uniref:Universal stress protein n=1 Tax=Edaphobacillus lindanitolerans TaxID=550447 RepID=A0A1U7PQ39_9BACI|nr:universal stress protein [Edaphobacillus lindanitolerans]SIT84096.1 Nucleotide-binding universal stress protein, UspA family [Edaphobacillus lindanitolerans]